MTYLVSDGKVFIADKFCSKQLPVVHGRKTQDAEGNRKSDKAEMSIYYNDTNKIELLSSGKYEGTPIKLFSVAGTTSHLQRALSYLNRGHDILDAMHLEACMHVSDRVFFRDDCSYLFVNTNNDVLMCSADTDTNSVIIHSRRPERIIHRGCGIRSVNALTRFIERPITALEAFVVASQLDENVSEEFDYYDLESNVLVHDQKLTSRQRNKILDKLQSEMVIDREINSVDYVNEIYQSVKG